MKANPNFVLREIYGKFILMPIRYNEASNDPVCLNDVAAQIWKATMISENRYILQKYICDVFELSDNSAEMYSVENFIDQMIEKKFIFE